MASFYDVNTVCNNIHNLIQSSGLHFVINQTPWSSYITIRKKSIGPHLAAKPAPEGCIEENEKLKEQIITLENALVNIEEDAKVEEQRSKQLIDNLHSKLDDLEKSLKTTEFNLNIKEVELERVEKEKTMKDELIQNINLGFNNKIFHLKVKIEGLEKFEKERIKKKKKDLKKLRQKAKKDQEKHVAVEPLVNNEFTNNNDENYDNKTFPCELCGKVFESVTKLGTHARTDHHEELVKVEKMF